MTTYAAQGLIIGCPFDLEFPPSHGTPDIVVAETQGPLGPELEGWTWYSREPDGTERVGWGGLFDWLISPDGRDIRVQLIGDEDRTAALETYLFGAVLSYSLIKLGFEPLHTTVLEVEGRGVGLMAQPGTGKSTLAATLLAEGHRLLTDDLLLLDHDATGWSGRVGSPRIKLYPETAAALLPGLRSSGKMNPLTSKEVIPVPLESFCSEGPLPMRALISLMPVAEDAPAAVRTLTGVAAFKALTENTFNTHVQTAERLERQLRFVEDICRYLPVLELEVPREMSRLPEVVHLIRGLP